MSAARRFGRTSLLAFAAATLTACDGSKGPAGTSSALEERLVGDYAARDDSFGGITYWARFAAGGELIELSERDIGVRRINHETWSVEDEHTGRIRIGSQSYTLRLASGDSSLILVSDQESDSTVYHRDAGMPDPNGWVLEVHVIEVFAAPNMDPTDLSWDGTGLWYPGRFIRSSLQRMNPTIGLAVDRTVPVTHGGYAVAYDNGNFWVDDVLDRRLYSVNGMSGATRLATTFVSPSTIHGLALAPDGRIWIGTGSTVTCFHPRGGARMDSLLLHEAVYGIESLDSVLFVALGSGGIARCEGPPWRVTATYALPGVAIHGLAYDGLDWWLYVIDGRGAVTTRIVRAKLSPTRLMYSKPWPVFVPLDLK